MMREHSGGDSIALADDQRARADAEAGLLTGDIPVLGAGQKLNVEAIRDPHEEIYLAFVWGANIVVMGVILLIAYFQPAVLMLLAAYAAIIALVLYVSWKLTYSLIYGNSIAVSPTQYPQIYRVVKEASDYLDIPVPTVLILQGHGMFELFVAKRFTRRGVIILTSNMMDEFSKKQTSREFMMYVGRQLGHIRAGHFRLWFFKEVVGRLALYFYVAWKRRCHFTADRIGLLVSGQIYSAEQALYIITVGAGIAPSTNYDDIAEQRTRLFESPWAWVHLFTSSYPYILDRVVRLRRFAQTLQSLKGEGDVGALPIRHNSLRSFPLLIIHGHDRLALLELKDFLYSQFPQVSPKVMMSTTAASLTLPEKFEMIAAEVRGAIALLTPDDVAILGDGRDGPNLSRARQNVIVEIGWVWGRLGRSRVLMLTRGDIDIPSDLSGIDFHNFCNSPGECAEAVRSFISQIEGETSS